MSKRELDELGVSAFCESMAMMVRAGIPVEEAVSLLKSGKSGEGVLERALEQMETRIAGGGSLADAMEQTGIFPEYAVRMISVGEDTGRLENVLFRLSRYYARQKNVSDGLRTALTYPAAMLLLIIAVLAAMLTLVLPAFYAVYDRLTGSLAASSYAYIRLAGVFCTVALVVMSLLALTLLTGLLLWKNGKRGAVIAALEKFPACRDILSANALFRFTSALSTLLASGRMQDDAVSESIPMAGSAAAEQKLRVMAGHMDQGHGIAQAAWEAELFEPVYGRMLLSGERSGETEQVLERLAELLEEDVEGRIERLTETVAPALSGVLMVTVGLTLVSVMLPLIGMMNAIG